MALVQPATVIQWHRQGFRICGIGGCIFLRRYERVRPALFTFGGCVKSTNRLPLRRSAWSDQIPPDQSERSGVAVLHSFALSTAPGPPAIQVGGTHPKTSNPDARN